jgi:hypothetical protein
MTFTKLTFSFLQSVLHYRQSSSTFARRAVGRPCKDFTEAPEFYKHVVIQLFVVCKRRSRSASFRGPKQMEFGRVLNLRCMDGEGEQTEVGDFCWGSRG